MLAEIADADSKPAIAPHDNGIPNVTGDARPVPPLPQSKLHNACLGNIGPNEPIFVLRAQDLLAPHVIEYWADLAHNAGAPAAKIAEARAIALVMSAWPHRKVPD